VPLPLLSHSPDPHSGCSVWRIPSRLLCDSYRIRRDSGINSRRRQNCRCISLWQSGRFRECLMLECWKLHNVGVWAGNNSDRRWRHGISQKVKTGSEKKTNRRVNRFPGWCFSRSGNFLSCEQLVLGVKRKSVVSDAKGIRGVRCFELHLNGVGVPVARESALP
jgi:hypothetical protein